MRATLYRMGVRGWRLHAKKYAGSPDLAFIGKKVAVFVDGAFWHGHPHKYRRGQSGAFWDEKITRNVERDRSVNEQLRAAGWTVVRLWDFEIEGDPQGSAARVVEALRPRRPS